MSDVIIANTDLITGEDLLRMGNTERCELIDGRIVSMSPVGDSQAFVEFNLGAELRTFVRQHNIGRVLGGEVGIYIRRNPDRIRAADVLVVSKERLPQLTGHFLEITPELVVEVISPGDRWQDVREKIADYFSIGVEQVWIVEPELRKILIYRSTTDIEEFQDSDELVGDGILAGFTIKISELFE
ncbi:MAG: Uma2 family endonuclease [Anaerolineae bacterium]|nr:Uma2 family endonuclease [Anaerolineae bacterium]